MPPIAAPATPAPTLDILGIGNAIVDVLSRAEDGHPDRETCRPCWQLSHRCAAGPYIDRSAATKAIVTAWT